MLLDRTTTLHRHMKMKMKNDKKPVEPVGNNKTNFLAVAVSAGLVGLVSFFFFFLFFLSGVHMSRVHTRTQ